GGMAVKCSILTQEQYEKSYYDHVNNPDVPYRDFLLSQNYLTEEQMQYVDQMVEEYYKRKGETDVVGEPQAQEESSQPEQPAEEEAFVADPDDTETVEGQNIGGGSAISEEEGSIDDESSDDGDLMAGFDDGESDKGISSDTANNEEADALDGPVSEDADSDDDVLPKIETPSTDEGESPDPGLVIDAGEEETAAPEPPADELGAPGPPEEEPAVPEPTADELDAPGPPEEEPAALEPTADELDAPGPPAEEETADMDTDTPVGLEAIQEDTSVKDEVIDFDADLQDDESSVTEEKGDADAVSLELPVDNKDFVATRVVLKNWQKKESSEEISCEAVVAAGFTDLALPADIIEKLNLEEIGEIEVCSLDGSIKSCRIFGMVEVKMEGKTCQVRAVELPSGAKPLLGAVPLLYLR
ncbi:hypothetical protein ACFL6F_03900, partial [Planctomycetota bacterium]